MSDGNSIPETERATKTAARVLFALCLVVALAIFVLNTSLADRRKLLEKNDERYQAHTQMVERLNSFRAKDAELFENLVTSSFHIAFQFHDSEKRYPGLVRTVRISPRSWGYVPVPEERQQRLNEAARSFGKGARAAFAAGQSVDDRLAALRAAATLAYQGDDEATAFVNVELAPKLAALDAPSEWRQIAWWIAGGEWPNPGGSHNVGGPGGVSFAARITESPTDKEDQFYAYRLLRFTPSPQSADQELFSLWKQSYTDRWSAATGAPRLAIPTLGLSISAEEAVAMAAPIVLLFQLMFLVHWERRSASPTSSDYSAFAFPSYGCPNDPLDGPFPATLGEGVQRFVWTLFLILPTCLFALGVLSRYDLHYPLGYFNGSTTTLFEAELWARSHDVVSRLIDWVTLGCMVLSSVATWRLTRPRFASERSSTRERAVALIAFVMALAFACVCVHGTRSEFDAYIAPLMNGSSVANNMGYLAAFGVVWSLFLGLAFQQRARFLALTSVIGLAVFALHFVPIAPFVRAFLTTSR